MPELLRVSANPLRHSEDCDSPADSRLEAGDVTSMIPPKKIIGEIILKFSRSLRVKIARRIVKNHQNSICCTHGADEKRVATFGDICCVPANHWRACVGRVAYAVSKRQSLQFEGLPPHDLTPAIHSFHFSRQNLARHPFGRHRRPLAREGMLRTCRGDRRARRPPLFAHPRARAMAARRDTIATTRP